MGFADLHIHTIHSYDGTSSISAVLKHVVEHTNLNVIAITDHDTMSGVKRAMELGPHYGIEVVPGCEVSTADGHLLALFVGQAPKPGQSLVETALRIADMGGICIAAHPTARGTSSLSFETIRQALEVPGISKALVGVEAINGGLVYTRRNSLVSEQAQQLPLAQVGNSDAHVLLTIGQGKTEFEGRTALDLRRALEDHATVAHMGKGLDGIGVLRSYIPRFLLRKLGWTEWNADPSQPMQLVRLSKVMSDFMPATNLVYKH